MPDPTITYADNGLNKTSDSVSHIVLVGSGFDTSLRASASYSKRTWSGSVLCTAKDGTIALVELTCTSNVTDEEDPIPDDTHEVSVTVGETTQPVKVNIYTP
jgi:hypothetical protein